MTKPYDTRSREKLLSAPHFAPYLEVPRLAEIGLRELRTLDAFFAFAAANDVAVPEVGDFLNFVSEDASPRRLCCPPVGRSCARYGMQSASRSRVAGFATGRIATPSLLTR